MMRSGENQRQWYAPRDPPQPSIRSMLRILGTAWGVISNESSFTAMPYAGLRSMFRRSLKFKCLNPPGNADDASGNGERSLGDRR